MQEIHSLIITTWTKECCQHHATFFGLMELLKKWAMSYIYSVMLYQPLKTHNIHVCGFRQKYSSTVILEKEQIRKIALQMSK